MRFLKFMSRYWLVLAICFIPLTALDIGCTEQQREQVDRIVADVNTLSQTGQEILESPAGQSLPPDIRLYGALAALLGTTASTAWQKWRRSQETKVVKSIVQGLENSGQSGKECKPNIAKAMKDNNVTIPGRILVDKLKT